MATKMTGKKARYIRYSAESKQEALKLAVPMLPWSTDQYDRLGYGVSLGSRRIACGAYDSDIARAHASGRGASPCSVRK
jgi:hypothetical protein